MLNMPQIEGIYENGLVTLLQPIDSKKAVPVVVSFLDEEISQPVKRLTLQNFSFMEAREQTKRYKGNLSDAVIEERN